MLTLGDFKFVVATTPALLEGVYRLRYQVYVEEFGFEHAGDHPEGMETDEWDSTSIHMAALNPEGDVIGTIRLVLNSVAGLPTLNAVAPFYRDRNPQSKHIGEVSRLAVARSFRRRVEDGFRGVQELASPQSSYVFHKAQDGDFPSQERRNRFAVVLGLFKIMYHVSKRINLKDWYMVAEKRLWYLLKRYHILFNPIGPEMDYHGVRIPYLGHIADIESHMMRVSASLAQSFQEGLDPVKPPIPLDQATSTPCEPDIQATAASPEPPPEPMTAVYTQTEADEQARSAAKAVAEIVWPHRIARPNP